MALAPAEPSDLLPRPRRTLRKRVVIATMLAGIGCLGALFYGDDARAWLRNVTTGDDVGGVYYPSARFMAEHVGCLDVFRPAHMPGNSTSSGECALANGTLIEFRTFNTGEGASAWLNGAQGQSGQLDRSGAGGVGGNWAIRVSGTTDREAMNRIFQSLPS